MSSHFSVILTNNVFTGENFDWKQNLKIVLFIEKHYFVLEEPCPELPPVIAPIDQFGISFISLKPKENKKKGKKGVAKN